jgi:HIV-1 Vpr-binding protein
MCVNNFAFQLVNDYLRDNYWSRIGNPSKDSRKLNIAACRLMLDIMPGLETSAVFQVVSITELQLYLEPYFRRHIARPHSHI